jgi:hypothetical protein
LAAENLITTPPDLAAAASVAIFLSSIARMPKRAKDALAANFSPVPNTVK